MDDIQVHEEQVAAETARFDAEVEKVKNDRNLSPEGKAKQEQALRQVHQTTVSGIQESARAELNKALERANRDLEVLRVEDAEYPRKVLGDAVYAASLREVYSRMEPEALVKAAREAPSDFERELVTLVAQYVFPADSSMLETIRATRPTGAKLVAAEQRLRVLQSTLNNLHERLHPFRREMIKARFNIR